MTSIINVCPRSSRLWKLYTFTYVLFLIFVFMLDTTPLILAIIFI